MFSSIKKGLAKVSLVAALLIGFGSSAHAGALDAYLVPGTLNFFEDNSREAYFDANNSGFFDVGDVLVGFLRIDQRTAPTSLDTGDSLYAVFSQEVASINEFGVITFKATTVDGLQLNDFDSDVGTNALVALYVGDVGLDLTLASPGAGSTLADYLALITAQELALTAGIVDSDDAFVAQSTLFPLSTSSIATFTTTDAVAGFMAMLTILSENSNFSFADVCTNTGFFGGAFGGIDAGTCAQLQILSGNVAGANNAANFGEWTNGSELGNFQQCDTNSAAGIQNNTPCGFIDNADINLRPVPEPASMILFGFGLAALGIYGRHSLNRKKSE
jgi:hypothetical protein